MNDSDLAKLAHPAPRSHHYSDSTIPRQPRITELTLIRYISLICLASYCGYIIMKWERITSCLRINDSYIGWTFFAIGVFTASLITLAAAIIGNKRPSYLLALPASALAYAQFPIIQIAQLTHYGNSPVGEMLLGDFVGIPACLLMMIFPNRWGFGILLASTSMIVTLQDNQLPFWHVSDLNAGLYSTLISGPVLFMVYSGIRTSRRADDAAFANYQAAMTMVRSTRLAELETYFISRIHDKVLSTLNSAAAGLTPIAEVSHIDIMAITHMGTMPVTKFIAALRDSVDDATRVIIHQTSHTATLLPLQTAISLIDAVTEACHNSKRYASDARRELIVRWNGTVMTIVFQDSGPGFVIDEVSHRHAGVKITMLKRPRIYRGITVSLSSAPGEGTRYEVTWLVTDTTVAVEESMGQQNMLLYQVEKLGFHQLFRPWVAGYAFLVFTFDVFLYDHTGRWHVLLISMGLVAGSLWSLTDRSQLRLPWRNTGFLVLCVSVLLTIGQLSHYSQPLGLQRYGWFLSYAAVLTMYLALRLRPVVAWFMWLGFAVVTYVAETWFDVHLLASTSAVIGCVPLLIPATIVPLQINWVARSLPTLQRVDRNEHLEVDRQRYTSEITEWLHTLLRLVDDPTVAKLMELRLRDAIRSPLLDVPELTKAVWQARAAGTQVTLIDDRSPAEPCPEPQANIIADAIAALQRHPAAVTLRLLPAGRDRYASLTWS